MSPNIDSSSMPTWGLDARDISSLVDALREISDRVWSAVPQNIPNQSISPFRNAGSQNWEDMRKVG